MLKIRTNHCSRNEQSLEQLYDARDKMLYRFLDMARELGDIAKETQDQFDELMKFTDDNDLDGDCWGIEDVVETEDSLEKAKEAIDRLYSEWFWDKN